MMIQRDNVEVYVSSGEVHIPLDDLSQWLLKNISAADLAEGLLNDAEMRELLINGLASRYSQMSIEDKHRREFLQKVKAEIHSQALDDLAKAMNAHEYAARNKAHYYWQRRTFNLWWRAVKETIERMPNGPEILSAVEKGHGGAFKETFEADDPDFFINGKHWNDSRDYWRKWAIEKFSPPEREG